MNPKALNTDPDYVPEGPYTLVEQRDWAGPTTTAGPYERFDQVWSIKNAIHIASTPDHIGRLHALVIIDSNGRIIDGHVRDERLTPPKPVFAVWASTMISLLSAGGEYGDVFQLNDYIEACAYNRAEYDELCRVRGL